MKMVRVIQLSFRRNWIFFRMSGEIGLINVVYGLLIQWRTKKGGLWWVVRNRSNRCGLWCIDPVAYRGVVGYYGFNINTITQQKYRCFFRIFWKNHKFGKSHNIFSLKITCFVYASTNENASTERIRCLRKTHLNLVFNERYFNTLEKVPTSIWD